MEKEEWIVYRVKRGVNSVAKHRWDTYVKHHPDKLKAMRKIIVADKLTKSQAEQFVALTKENEE